MDQSVMLKVGNDMTQADLSACVIAASGQYEAPDPISPIQRVYGLSHGLASLFGSLLVHCAMAAALFASTGQPSKGISAGGQPTIIEATIAGYEETVSSREGAKAAEAEEPDDSPTEPAKSVEEIKRAEVQDNHDLASHAAEPDRRSDLTVATQPSDSTPADMPTPIPPTQEALPRATPPPNVAKRPQTPLSAIHKAEATPVRKQVDKPTAKLVIRTPTKPLQREFSRSNAVGHHGEGRSATSSRADSRGGTGGAGSMAGSAHMSSYRSQVIAHLARHKIYPEQAQNRGITGQNAVTLTLARDGRVLTSQLAAASGDSSLDAATLAAVRRAQPFPPPPQESPAQVTVTIGLRYDIR